MEYIELNLPHRIEIRFLRLNKPNFTTSTPFFGEYIDNHHLIDTNNDMSLPSKDVLIKSFNLTEIFPNSNALIVNKVFGKIFFMENLEAIMFISNLSNSEEIKIKLFKVSVENEQLGNNSSNFKNYSFVLYEQQDIIIKPGGYHFAKIKFCTDMICKYTITTDIQYSCNSFNNEYLKNVSINNKLVKSVNKDYFIEQNKGMVVRKFNKKMAFDNNIPFRIKEKIIMNNNEKAIIEITIINLSLNTLHISDFSLMVNTSNKNNIHNEYLLSLKDKSILDKLIIPITKVEEFSLENEDEYSLLFIVENAEIFQLIDKFTFKFQWLNYFDSLPKQLSFSIENKNYYANVIKLLVIDKSNQIIRNKVFNFKLAIQNLTQSKYKFRFLEDLYLKITTEKQSDKDLEILDIIPNVRINL